MSRWLSISAFLMALAVAMGAFAAHGLKGRLSPYALEVFQKASFYHFVHALSILLVVALAQSALITEAVAARTASIFLAGIVLFSGSLYLLAITDLKWLGAITPIGGVLFIAGWLLLALAR